jgi:hypothetical protein
MSNVIILSYDVCRPLVAFMNARTKRQRVGPGVSKLLLAAGKHLLVLNLIILSYDVCRLLVALKNVRTKVPAIVTAYCMQDNCCVGRAFMQNQLQGISNRIQVVLAGIQAEFK